MIFTDEQVKLLPGSTVRTRATPRIKIPCDAEIIEVPHHWGIQLVHSRIFANKKGFTLISDDDIAAVLEWSDEKKPKTAREWLEEIEHPEIKRRALCNANAQGSVRKEAVRACHRIADALAWAFDWSETREGRDFWLQVAAHFSAPDICPMPTIPSEGPLEVGMVFEGRATETDGGPRYKDNNPISIEQRLVEGIPMRSALDLGLYGRVFRTEIRIVEEITDAGMYAQFCWERSVYLAEIERHKNMEAARLGLPSGNERLKC